MLEAPHVGEVARSDTPLLSVRDLHVSFRFGKERVAAVSGVSFDIFPGEVFAVVGESGSGKSVTAMSILGLVGGSSRVDSGSVTFDGVDLLGLSEKEMRHVRGGQIGMIFQDPMTALNPLLTVGTQIGESARKHLGLSKAEAELAAIELLRRVGIPHAKDRIGDYPHQFSGGMRQRVVIAMAMIANPRMLIADEPTTALDVTIQAQILKLLKELTDSEGVALMLITHDLGVVASVADRVMVMYAGQAHETGSVERVFSDPLGPYTWGLMDSIPHIGSDVSKPLSQVSGRPPAIEFTPSGCRFHPRCPYVRRVCETTPVEIIYAGNHGVRCHFGDDPDWRSVRAGRSIA